MVRGQYRGYREEPEVAKDSTTPTYVALKMYIDNWRWQGVPFYVRAGKGLKVTATEALVLFAASPALLSKPPRTAPTGFQVAPNGAVALGVRSKAPGRGLGRPAERARDALRDPADAYTQRLIGDTLEGDPTLFAREECVEAEWRVVNARSSATSPRCTSMSPAASGPGGRPARR